MTDLIRLILDTIQFIWPFHRVEKWERALYIVCGRWMFEVGPGVYPVLWWFCTLHQVGIAEAPCGTHRLDITLRDGKLVSLEAVAMARVIDVTKAVCDVEHYANSTAQILAAVCADRLAEVDAERMEPDKRSRLLSDLTRWVNKETEVFGVSVREVRFTSLVLNLRANRFLVDQSTAAIW